MPRVTAADVCCVINAFDPALKREICIPTYQGKRGHPILFAARFLPEIEALRGDVGARSVIERHPGVVHLVRVDHPGVLLDVDTPQAFRSLSPANLPEEGLGRSARDTRCRNSRGVSPVARRNAKAKAEGEENPSE